jgi:hypothetical protein
VGRAPAQLALDRRPKKGSNTMRLTNTQCAAVSTAWLCLLAMQAQATSVRLIDQFNHGGNDPYYGVTVANGQVFGVTSSGGNKGCDAQLGCGTVFMLQETGNHWASTTLYTFKGHADGAYPYPLTIDTDGTVYGSTGAYNYGTVFRLLPPGAGSSAWTYEELYRFTGGKDGNLNCNGFPLLVQNGTVYGLACGATTGGTFYAISQTGGSWHKSVLARFRTSIPSSLAGFDAAGGAYIATSGTGATAYRLAPPQGGSGGWPKQVLAHYKGALPTNLVLSPDGNLFGLEQKGRQTDVFELSPPTGGGTAWTKTIISAPRARGYGPSSLALGANGTLVGAIYGDQDSYGGALYQITPAQGFWTTSILWNFGTQGPASNPLAVVYGGNNDYFGVLNDTYSNGQVFELK